MALTAIYRTFYPTTAKYTHFSSTNGTFSRIDHRLGHKTSLSKFNKTEIIPNTFYDHNGIETRNQQQEKNWKTHNYKEIKQYFPEQPMDQRRN